MAGVYRGAQAFVQGIQISDFTFILKLSFIVIRLFLNDVGGGKTWREVELPVSGAAPPVGGASASDGMSVLSRLGSGASPSKRTPPKLKPEREAG